MGCEKQPLEASPTRKTQLDSSVYFTRVERQARTSACIDANNRRCTATSVTEVTKNVAVNRQLNPAADVTITHPKKKNRDHCPSHSWQAWQLASTRHSR